MNRQDKLNQKKQQLEEMKAKREAISQENKEKLKAMSKGKKIFYGFIAFILIGSIVSSFGRSDVPEESNKTEDVQEAEEMVETVEEVPTEEPENEAPIEELSFEEQVKSIATKTSGNKLLDFEITENEIIINLEMQDNFTNKLIISGMKSTTFSILKQLQELVGDTTISDITVTFKADFTDKYGNVSQDNASMFLMETSELMKINFDNILTDNLIDLCSVAWIHPAFKN